MCLTEYQKYKQPIEKKNILKIKDEWILVIINDWTLISTCKASGGFLKWMVFTDARSSLWSLPLKWKFKKNSWNSFADSWKALGDSTFVCEGASRSATDIHCACGFHFDIVLELIIKSSKDFKPVDSWHCYGIFNQIMMFPPEITVDNLIFDRYKKTIFYLPPMTIGHNTRIWATAFSVLRFWKITFGLLIMELRKTRIWLNTILYKKNHSSYLILNRGCYKKVIWKLMICLLDMFVLFSVC